MASKIWEAGLALSLVFTALATLGPVRVSSSSDAAICPAASPVNSILQLPDSCSDSDRDPIGVTEVCSWMLSFSFPLVIDGFFGYLFLQFVLVFPLCVWFLEMLVIMEELGLSFYVESLTHYAFFGAIIWIVMHRNGLTIDNLLFMMSMIWLNAPLGD